jgi:uncharacterized phage protein (TIGR02218 family)
MSGFLTRELTGFALCWRLERRDGVAIGLTSHDRDLVVDHFLYRSAPGIAPSALEDGDVMQADALEVSGALSGAAISEDDLRAGRWDGARVRVLAVDWSEPSDRVQLLRGEMGIVSLEEGRFTAELKGPGAALDRPVVEETSPYCRAELGDRRCRIDMAGRRSVARVVAIEGRQLTVDATEPVANGWGGGRLRWLTGAASGLSSTVLSSAGSELQLADVSRVVGGSGDLVELVAGCDKRFASCRDRFANALNFRGEPHLPGVDLLTRYPGE